MKIKEITQEIRAKSLKKIKKKPIEKLAASWFQDDLMYSGKGKSIFLILPTPGCSWALSDSGGCTMCSYVSDCSLEPLDSHRIVETFLNHLERYEITDETCIKMFASGSFLNPEELPLEARNEILSILAGMPNISEIVVESRPEYVTENTLREIMSIIPDKLFEVSIGLESEDDYTREEKINKGFSREDFENAINSIISLKGQYNVKSKSYILVKPILTSEKEAIDGAVKTANYAYSVGVDRISFCPTTIHKGTLLERLWRTGAYQPPWIWSTVEIINTVRRDLPIPALMDTSGFGSRRGPFNCKKCNKTLKNMIIDSNLTQGLIEGVECECKNKWLGEVKFSNMNYSPTFTKYQEYE